MISSTIQIQNKPDRADFIAEHGIFLAVLSYSAFLTLSGLGNSVLQVDEGLDTFVTTTIGKFVLPMHSDGVNSTMEFADARGGVFILRTWFPYYLQALFLAIFGHNTIAARLPFALCGVAAVAGVYFLSLRLGTKKSTASLAAFLFASSVPALLYFRTARYIVLPMLLTPLLLIYYLKIFEGEKWNPLPFVVISILYFHSMYVEFAATVFGILIHFLLHRKISGGENTQRVIFSAGAISVLTLPWLIFIYPVFSRLYEHYRSTGVVIDSSFWGYLRHVFAFLFQLNNYIFPFVLLPFIFLKSLGNYRMQLQLLFLCIVSLVAVSGIHSIPLQQYIAACLPLLFIAMAIIVNESFAGWVLPKLLTIVLLVTTNIFHVGVFLPLKTVLSSASSPYLKQVSGVFKKEVGLKSVYYDYWYEVTYPVKGSLDTVVEYFNRDGKPEGTCYIDSEADAFIFYYPLKLIRGKKISLGDKPDWVILRDGVNPVEEDIDVPEAEALKSIVRSNPYEKITLTGPVWRINNSYEIQLHRFKMLPLQNKIYIYRRVKTLERITE